MLRRILLLSALVAGLVIPTAGQAEESTTVVTAPYTAGEACGIVSTPRPGPPDALIGGDSEGGCTSAPAASPLDPGHLAEPARNGLLFHGGWAEFYFPPYYRGPLAGVYRSTTIQRYTTPVTGNLSVTAHLSGQITGLGVNPYQRLSLCLSVFQNGLLQGQDCTLGERPIESSSDPFRDLSVAFAATQGTDISVRVNLEGPWDPGTAQAIVEDITFVI